MTPEERTLNDLNHSIQNHIADNKKNHRMSEAVMRHSQTFAINSSKEATPKHYKCKLTTHVILSDDKSVLDFDVVATFQKGL